MSFTPDYTNLEKSARNTEVFRTPLYEHLIAPSVMEAVLGRKFADLIDGDESDKREYFKHYCEFFVRMGYDTVSFEGIISGILPGNGALYKHTEGVIKTRSDFEAYPWDEVADLFFRQYGPSFAALRTALPPGMKAVGGPGNGIFECVQDIVGYQNLCYISADDPDLYADLFRRMGDTIAAIWERFIAEFGDIYCVLRFGDDLGYKSNTLLPKKDILGLILPQYKKVVSLVHRAGKPFLLHSCGNIFEIMEPLISEVGIDAKHSNEDQIAPFPVWVEKYGSRIGNFGGIDTDAVCRLSEEEIREYVSDIFRRCRGHGGFAFGTGNSIPDYVPVDKYISMIQAARTCRKE